MKHFTRLVTLSLTVALSLGLTACAPEAGSSEAGSSEVERTAQAATVVGRVVSEPTAEVVAYRYSLAVRGDGLLLDAFRRRAVNELAGVVVFDQTDETNALRRRMAEDLLSISPRTGQHYYDPESVAAGSAILRDLANQTAELVTVTFTGSAEGERVSITCRGGQPPWARVFTPAELRDPATCVDALLTEVRRQVEVFRGTLP